MRKLVGYLPVTARSDAPDRSADETLLKASFGQPFVAWVLNGPSDPPTDEQKEVTSFLEEAVRRHSAEHPDWPVTNVLAPLLGFADGPSGIQRLRLLAGGTLPDPPLPTGDDFLDAVIATTVDIYPETLLLGRDPFITFIGAYSSPNGRKAAELAATEPMTQVENVHSLTRSVEVLRSTGSGGSVQTIAIAPSLISAAWETARLDHDVPTLEELLAQLPKLLLNARAAFQNKPARVTGLASLTGLLLPPGTVLDVGWGRLRVAETRHHPDFIRRTLAQQRTSRQLEDGTEIAISDAGEVLLETDLPYEVAVGEFDLSTGKWPTLRSRDLLEERLVLVRLAYMLSAPDGDPAVVLSTWQRFIEPVTQGSSIAYSDPSRFAGRQPTRLDSGALSRWQLWIERLSNVPLRRLGVAPTRLLRAVAERRDPHDALIDAVIAWESLFASDTEAVLRVSASMARLLHPAGPQRNSTKSELAKIYRTRSQVVHGNDVGSGEAYDASRAAIAYGTEVLRRLVAERADLIPLPAAERSTAILLE